MPCLAILTSHSAVGCPASCLQIVGQGQVGSLLESLFQRWNVSYGLIQLHALYPVEWIENRRQTALLLGSPLLQPFIKTIQVQTMNGNSGGIEIKELSPDLFPGTVKNCDNGGVNFMGCVLCRAAAPRSMKLVFPLEGDFREFFMLVR